MRTTIIAYFLMIGLAIAGSTNYHAYRPSIPYGGKNQFLSERLPLSLVTNCTGWYTFSQTNRAGTQYTYNVTRQTNDVTVSGAVYSNANNGFMYFDKSDDYLYGSSSMFNATTGFSVCFWAKPSDVDHARAVVSKSRFQSPGWDGWNIEQQSNSTNTYMFQIGTGSSQGQAGIAKNYITNGIWHFFCSVYETNGNVSMYLNGIQRPLNYISSLPYTSGANQSFVFQIGKHDDSSLPRNYGGGISDVAIFPIAITSNDQFEIYNAQKSTYGY